MKGVKLKLNLKKTPVVSKIKARESRCRKMIERAISEKLRISATQVPVVTLLGPRQAGKTTLVRDLFPDYTYVNLEDRVTRELALNDYIGFFSKFSEPMIIDEVQRAPELLSAR